MSSVDELAAARQYLYAKRWRLDRARGIPRLTDAAEARRHIECLRAAGVSIRAIAAAAGLSATTISRTSRGLDKQIKIRVHSAILSVTVETARQRNGRAFVPAVGSRRRIHALYAIGHTADTIAEICELDAPAIRNALNAPGTWITAAKDREITRAYNQLWNKPGASTHNRSRAKRNGWAPPLAWDDDTIDLSNAIANLSGRSDHQHLGRPTLSRVVADVEDLLASATAPSEIASRLGYTCQSNLAAMLYRANRHDLVRRFDTPHREIA